MRTLSFGKIIGSSFAKTIQILFRPLRLRKWVLLGIIAMLAGQLGGLNFSFNAGGPRRDVVESRIKAAAPQISISQVREKVLPVARHVLSALRKDIGFTVVFSLSLVFIVITILLWTAVKSIFSFVFIEAVVKNDASYKAPFHRNKALGWSYTWWNLLFGTFATVIMVGLLVVPAISVIKSGLLANFPHVDIALIFKTALPYLVSFGASLFLYIIIDTSIVDFVLVIMYARRSGFLKSLGRFIKLCLKNIVDMAQYFVLKFILFLASLVCAFILLIIAVLVFLLIAGILALIGFAIFKFSPPAAKPFVSIILLVIGLPALVTGIFLLAFAVLPVPVFFRLFSIYFMGSLNSAHDLFAAQPPSSGDEEKYKKPIALLYSALGATIVLIVLILSTLFMGGRAIASSPYVVKTKPDAAGKERVQVKSVGLPMMNSVKVLLKNGRFFEAEVVNRTPTTVTLKIEGGEVILNTSDIESIQ